MKKIKTIVKHIAAERGKRYHETWIDNLNNSIFCGLVPLNSGLRLGLDAIDHDRKGGIRTLTFDVDVWKELDNGKDPEPVIREEMKEYLSYPDDNFIRICRFETMPTHLDRLVYRRQWWTQL